MTFATTNPYTGETLKTFPEATQTDIDAAIDLAHAAFLVWRETVILPYLMAGFSRIKTHQRRLTTIGLMGSFMIVKP